MRRERLCRCGHTLSDHHGTLSREHRVLSKTACLAGTKFITAGAWGERVGGDGCHEWNPPTLWERIKSRWVAR